MTTRARFCPRCGGQLAGPPPTVCARCGYALYVNARPTAGVILIEDGRFLALCRAAEPRAGQWELPGGFCDGWEHPTDAAVREAREELGLDVALGPFVGMYLGEYLFQDEVLPVLEMYWLARRVGGELRVDPAESRGYRWLALDAGEPLAFPSMEAAIKDASKLIGWRV